MNKSALFFELIQVSLSNRTELFTAPTSDEWEQLFAYSRKQALHGICFYGLQKLPKEQLVHLPPVLKMQWLGLALNIQKRNELMNYCCRDLQKTLFSAGFKNSILKGQSMALLYSSDSFEYNTVDFNQADKMNILGFYRQPGDIDVYIDAKCEEVIRYVRSMGVNFPNWDYKHLHLKLFKDIDVEVHYVPEVFLNIWKNLRLQKWFANHQEWIFSSTGDANSVGKLITPSLEFNVFYILLHIYRHFLYEGIGLRQLMDYYFVLKAYSSCPIDNHSKVEIVRTIENFGMMRFANGIMWVLVEVFEGGNISSQLSALGLFKPDRTEGAYILDQIMLGGNFGHYDERLIINKSGKIGTVYKIVKHNLHILSHYPSDVVWTPVWVIWHWIWKRMKSIILK